MIDGDVEEALDLAGVQVDRQHAVDAGRGQQIGDQARRDRRARLALAVLAGVTEVGDDRDDRAGRRALERVDHDQQLHQVVVGGRAGRLDDEAVHAADVLVDLDVDLTVGEARHLGVAERRLDVAADRLRQLAVGVATEYGEGFEHEKSPGGPPGEGESCHLAPPRSIVTWGFVPAVLDRLQLELIDFCRRAEGSAGEGPDLSRHVPVPTSPALRTGEVRSLPPRTLTSS